MPFPVVYAPVLLVKEQDIYVLENLQDACEYVPFVHKV